MDTGRERRLHDIESGREYDLPGDGPAATATRDGRRHATAYGPFTRLEAEDDPLRRHHANPRDTRATTCGSNTTRSSWTRYPRNGSPVPAPRGPDG